MLVEIKTIDRTKELASLRNELAFSLKENYQYYLDAKQTINPKIKPLVIKSLSVGEDVFEVIVTSNSIGELLTNGGHEKYCCFFQLNEIVENGQLARIEQPKEKNIKNEKNVYFFHTKVMVDSVIYLFIFTVKEMMDKNKLKRVYSGHMDIKKPLAE